MNTILIALKVLFYSMIGYYIESFVAKKEIVFRGPIFLFYGLFGLLANFSDKIPVIYLYILGITWGIIINTLLEAFDKRLKTELHVKYFGLINIINVLIIEDLFDKFISSSSLQSTTFLFIFGVSVFIIDLVLTFRSIL